MKIKLQFKITPFDYEAPIAVLNQTLKSNNLLNISFFLNDIFVDQVDCMALPSFHQYNIIEWKYFLENFFSTNPIELDNIKLDYPFFNMVKNSEHLGIDGELLFLVESILFKIIEKKANDILNFIKKYPVKINALYSKDIKMSLLPECIKIKIRPNQENLMDTIHLTKSLLLNKPDIKIRLDGNRQFEFYDLNSYILKLKSECGAMLSLNLDYIEEPFKNFSDSFLFKHYFSYSIAVDESLYNYRDNLLKLKKISRNTNLIIKPSLLGISKSFHLLNLALSYKQNVIISSSYEAPSSFRGLLFLAALNPKTYHGFDTLKFLPNNLSIPNENYLLNF